MSDVFVSLTSEKDIQILLKQGVYTFSSYITIKWISNNKNFSRWLIVVSNKVDKRSVVRNKIRRRIRGWINVYNKNIKNGLDIAIIVKQKAVNLSYSELSDEIFKLLNRKGIFLLQ